MPGVFGRIGGAIDNVAEPLGYGINRLLKGSMRAGHMPSGTFPAGNRMGSAIASAYRTSMQPQNIRTGRKAIGAGAALGGIGFANKRKDHRGGYNPRRPIAPVPQNGRPI